MSNNSNYNSYPCIIIDNNFQVHGVAKDQSLTSLSEPSFTMNIGISEDGTLWAISLTPDPDGGGGRIYWSTGNGQWNEINTSDPGGVAITGGSGSSCFFLSADGSIWSMDTNGIGQKVYSNHNVIEMDAGGGYIWAVLSIAGKFPTLHYSPWTTPFNFQEFPLNEGASPMSISVNYQGNCLASENLNPVYYSNDGSQTGSAGKGINGKTLDISFKNWNFALSTELNENGNLAYEWQDIEGGTYKAMSIRAYQILATYHEAG